MRPIMRHLIVVLLLLFFIESTGIARSRFRSSSSRSYSSSSRSFSSSKYSTRSRNSSFFNRKVSQKKSINSAGVKKNKSASSYSSSRKKVNAGTKKTGFKNGRPVTGSKADRGLSRTQKLAKAKQAKKQYSRSKGLFGRKKNEKFNKNQLPDSQKKALNRVQNTPGYNPSDYHYRRSAYLGGYSPSPFMYSAMPYRWGVWDTVMLMYILDHGSRYHHRMYYDNRNDPDIRRFRSELNELSRSNSELTAKLNRLEASEKAYQQQGLKPVPGRIPEDIGDLAFAEDAISDAQPRPAELNITTGGPSGIYYQFGQQLAKCIEDKEVNLKINVLQSPGTLKNIENLASRQVDAAVIQADGLDEYFIRNPGADLPSVQASLYKEKIFIIVRDDSGIKGIKDIAGNQKKYAMVFKEGSGAALTFRNLGREDDSYQGFQVVNKSGEEALNLLSNSKDYYGKQLAMFVVMGMNSNLLKIADQKHKDLKIVPYDDWDANDYLDRDGNPVYSFSKIPAVYKNLQPKGLLWGTKSVKSVDVESVFFLSDSWVEENEDVFDDVAICGSIARNYVQRLVRQK